MADVLLTLIVPTDIAQHVEDLLLSRPDLVRGFTTSAADGHGSVVTLSGAEELVGGHAPRMLIRTAGPEDLIRSLICYSYKTLQAKGLVCLDVQSLASTGVS